ncbi:carboxymuconolactone decarboxylase family protein [Phytomonospora endophytica]|uniref:AhpD family alkylhydroperoxidase n=1 Tax=Phytomonospora endophytica TaxID=714109 RepID=A0A841FNT7_9ACTN|nr:carboxymuconolactone decarboxylase family protein [Phytomonospora endophytica]MBB6037766.1 AhpD family alkylhydroperoxidase [Phytomonospora endophytica]GIG67704.1 alkyl hydroperoxide reductase AhpD [Phytomonospora endophytica]
MQPRMKNPAAVIEGAYPAVQALLGASRTTSVPATTLELVHLRASQINGCSACVHGGAFSSRKAGVADRQVDTVAAWRETPYFSDAERAALALTEAATRLADNPDGVPDEIWDEAAGHYDEEGLAAIVLTIATTNMLNRLNATTRQIAGQWG